MATSKPIVFLYSIVGRLWSPMVSAGINLGRAWKPVELYLDSGATYTVVRARVAEEIGFDYAKGRKVFAQVGDGAVIPVFLHDLPVQIGDRSFVAPVGFSSKLGVPFNLLGRLGVFDRFRICFHEKRKVVSFQAVD